jgi:hypothetical protein
MEAWNQTTNQSSKCPEQKNNKSQSEIYFIFHGAYAPFTKKHIFNG